MIYVTHDQLEASTFADKIAVMYEGRIVQFGTPTELFENPNHTFVGFFIGSPGMNLMPVSRSGDGLRFGESEISLSDDLRQRLAGLDTDNLKLGIRPEFVEQAEPGQDAHAAVVEDVEDLGTYQIVTASLEGQALKVRLSEDARVDRGQTLHLHFPPRWLKLYADEYLVEATS